MREIRCDGLSAHGAGSVAAFDDGYDAVQHALARRDRLGGVILELAEDSEFTEITHRLACLRGISTLTGFALAVEIGDWDRFTGSTIAAYLGLVPSEYSSGQSRVQGGITRTGNSHARRLLIESAWQHKARYFPGPTIRKRWQQVPATIAERATANLMRSVLTVDSLSPFLTAFASFDCAIREKEEEDMRCALSASIEIEA